ncbi:MAG: hypothetical protein ACRC35_06100 [Angustibacter sp.]
MSVHAFVDESVCRDRYLLTATMIDPVDLRRLRRHARGLLFAGQREVHRSRPVLDVVERRDVDLTAHWEPVPDFGEWERFGVLRRKGATAY